MYNQTGRVRMGWLVHSVLVFTFLTDDSERDDMPKAGGVRVKNITPRHCSFIHVLHIKVFTWPSLIKEIAEGDRVDMSALRPEVRLGRHFV